MGHGWRTFFERKILTIMQWRWSGAISEKALKAFGLTSQIIRSGRALYACRQNAVS